MRGSKLRGGHGGVPTNLQLVARAGRPAPKSLGSWEHKPIRVRQGGSDGKLCRGPTNDQDCECLTCTLTPAVIPSLPQNRSTNAQGYGTFGVTTWTSTCPPRAWGTPRWYKESLTISPLILQAPAIRVFLGLVMTCWASATINRASRTTTSHVIEVRNRVARQATVLCTLAQEEGSQFRCFRLAFSGLSANNQVAAGCLLVAHLGITKPPSALENGKPNDVCTLGFIAVLVAQSKLYGIGASGTHTPV